MPLKEQIQAILQRDYKGPRTGFGEVEILKALLAIGNSPIALGRSRLGQQIGLGQGEIKTLIARLKANELIVVGESGCSLTGKGKKKFDSISKSIRFSGEIEEGEELNLGRFTWAVVIHDGATKIRRGIEQRDEAIRFGAEGALTVVFSSGKFKIPEDDRGLELADCEVFNSNDLWNAIRSKARLADGDVVILGGARTLSSAEDGALAAALTIL